nr:MAG TPA: hypothetical protein [Bacteriophage sp.]
MLNIPSYKTTGPCPNSRGLKIIYSPRQPNRRLSIPFRVLRKGVVLMYMTYGDLFTFIIMITGIIALIVQIHKK